MTIPFVDLKSQYQEHKAAIQARLNAVLEHGAYIMGPEIEELETLLAKEAGTRHALSCSSGTDAIIMALMAYGIGPGDAVFTTPFTYVATVEAVQWVGATPVLVDILPDTFNIDPHKLEATVARVVKEGKLKPRCLLPVDIFGQPADYKAIRPIAQKHDMVLLGDGAQSMGSRYHGKASASWADTWTTSFFPAKPLGCYGDGGAIFTDSDDIAALLRSIRVHGGGKDKYHTVRLGMNGRLDSLQAAVLLAKLPSFPGEIETRNAVAGKYSKALKGLVETPVVLPEAVSAWAQYSVLSDHRAALREALQAAGVPTAVYYEIPMHLQPSLSALGHKAGDFPVAESVSKRVFSLPMHPYLKDETIKLVGEVVRKTLASKR